MGNLYKEAIPQRGDCKKKLKNYNDKEISRISTKFQLCYNHHVFDRPLILLQKESDWINLLGKLLIN